MPTYEYGCTSCGQHIEVFQRISEDPLTTCGVCGGKLRKVFHPAGIVFKGSGFYATDSRSASKSSGDDKQKTDTATTSSGSGEGGSSKGPEGGSGSSSSSDGTSSPTPDAGSGSKKETSSS